jgi:hypothetical protein
MLLAVTLYQVVLAVHIMAVVVAFGVTFAYPVIFAVAQKRPRSMPDFYRAEKAVGQRVILPGLLIVMLAGIYLASKGHYWKEFWVQWPLGVAILLGGLGGMFFGPTEAKLIEIADRDVAAAGDGEVTFSAEYDVLARRVQIVGGLSSLLVLVTIYIMTVKPFA